ncbi:hypothetical protein [Brucella intermedia]|uniref:hypothetical protein n=1 Tax=Brucella intermedia TaxID=94625 RepID=UPI00124CF3E6|nr:hypothetical protein [Brucella intermedia]KAB2725416.1 hypothetical protein F9L02_19535 [Brucella intermedia]
MKSHILAYLIVVLSSGSAFSEAFFCTGEASGGMRYTDNGWKGVPFNVDGDQFVVSNTPENPNVYTVREMGKDYTKFRCNRSIFSGELSDQMTCGGLGWGMIINLKDLRYTEIYTIGYIENDTTGKNTPSITSGKCTKIDTN